MKKYKIPETFIIGFEILRTLNQKDTDKIISAIEDIPVGTGPEEFENILNKVLPINQLHHLATAIYSFGSLLTSLTENSIEQIADNLALSFDIQSNNKLSDKEIEKFKIKLINIFTKCSNLKYTFKAINLIIDNQRVYGESRIITDIRFVFNDDISDKNRKALIIHQLKIEYQKEEEIQEFFVSLDADDLIQLREQIDRSIEKEKQIRNTYNNISFIELTK